MTTDKTDIPTISIKQDHHYSYNNWRVVIYASGEASVTFAPPSKPTHEDPYEVERISFSLFRSPEPMRHPTATDLADLAYLLVNILPEHAPQQEPTAAKEATTE